jgi:hypothetical protein
MFWLLHRFSSRHYHGCPSRTAPCRFVVVIISIDIDDSGGDEASHHLFVT